MNIKLGDKIITTKTAQCGPNKKGMILCKHPVYDEIYGIKFDTISNKFHKLENDNKSKTKRLKELRGLWLTEKDFELQPIKNTKLRQYTNFILNMEELKIQQNERKTESKEQGIRNRIIAITDYKTTIENMKEENKTNKKEISELLNKTTKIQNTKSQFMKLKKHKLILDIFTTKNYLVCKTKQLTYHHSNWTTPDYILGAFYIFIPKKEDEYGTIRIINYIKQIKKLYYHHPCVKTQGMICLGEDIKNEIDKYYNERNYTMIFYLIINFLQEPNYTIPYLTADEFKAAQPVTFKPTDIEQYLVIYICEDNEIWNENKYTKKIISTYKKQIEQMITKKKTTIEEKIHIDNLKKKINILKQYL